MPFSTSRMKASSAQLFPQSRHDIEELTGAAVALAMFDMLVEAEVQRRLRIGRRDDVPAGAPAADMVERGELAGDVIGLVEGGGRGGDQPETLGHYRERRQQRERIKGGDGGAALQCLHRHVQQGQMIGHEECVEPPLLELLREALEMREVEVRVGIGAGIAPGGRMDADRPHERAKAQLTCASHLGGSFTQGLRQQDTAFAALADFRNGEDLTAGDAPCGLPPHTATRVSPRVRSATAVRTSGIRSRP